MFRKNKNQAPEQPNQTDIATETEFEAYPIENAIRRVTVRRSSGEIDNGWFVVGETTDGTRYVVQKFDADSDEVQEKRILKADLDAMQTWSEQPRSSEAPRSAADDLAGAALKSALPQPETLSERVAAGWNVPRSELLAAVGQPVAEQKVEAAQAKRDAREAGHGENS